MSEAETSLWLAVILQSKQDVEGEPLGSLHYNDACSFFIGLGAWAKSRADIATLLDMDADYLTTVGRQWIVQRRLAEGLPAEDVPPAPPRPVIADLPVVILAVIAAPTKRSSIGSQGGKVWSYNPFNPLLRDMRK